MDRERFKWGYVRALNDYMDAEFRTGVTDVVRWELIMRFLDRRYHTSSSTIWVLLSEWEDEE